MSSKYKRAPLNNDEENKLTMPIIHSGKSLLSGRF